MTDEQQLKYLKYSLELVTETIGRIDAGNAPWRREIYDDLVECEASCDNLLSRMEQLKCDS